MAATPEEMLKEKLGDDFERKISGKTSEFGGLLTRAAAVRLLCRQNGILADEKIPLSQASAARLPFTFRAAVDRIYPLQAHANGSGRSVRLHLSDGEGQATLVLWNEQTALVEGGIGTGDNIECSGAYFRGGEIWVGRNGSVKRVASASRTPIAKLTSGLCNVEGEVKEAEPDYEYLDKRSGEARKLSSFRLCSDGHCRRVVVWPSPGREKGPELSAGDRLLLENVVFRKGELHFNSYSRMVVKKSAREKAGILDRAFVEGEESVLQIGGTAFRLPIQDALTMLGIGSVPDGVGSKTMFLLRAQDAVGRKAKYRLGPDGKLAWLEL